MLFRKTHKRKIKDIIRDKYKSRKEPAMYSVTTYWFLFIPVYSYETFID